MFQQTPIQRQYSKGLKESLRLSDDQEVGAKVEGTLMSTQCMEVMWGGSYGLSMRHTYDEHQIHDRVYNMHTLVPFLDSEGQVGESDVACLRCTNPLV
jgi:hypothetical protein